MKLTETKDGTIIEIYVKPNSQHFEVIIENDEIVVRCSEEPVRGKVNKELIRELSKLFRSKVELVSGSSSREKKLLLRGIERNEVERLLPREGT